MDETQSEGIVLRSLDYKERQRIVTVFTPDAGLISIIFPYLSRRAPRLLTLSSPFCLAEFIYQKGKSDLFKFKDGTILDDMHALRLSFEHLQTAGELAQAILHSQMPGKPSPLLYALFSAYMKQVSHFESPSMLTASFYLKVLKHEGLIALSRYCTVCDNAPARHLYRGECFCTHHAPDGALVLSEKEMENLGELLSAQRFEYLKNLTANRDLTVKLSAYFREHMKQ